MDDLLSLLAAFVLTVTFFVDCYRASPSFSPPLGHLLTFARRSVHLGQPDLVSPRTRLRYIGRSTYLLAALNLHSPLN